SPHRPAGQRRPDQSGDLRPAVPVRAYGRMAPAQDLHQTRHRLPPRTARRTGTARTGRPASLAAASATGDLAAVDVQDLASDVGQGLQEQPAVDDVTDLAGPAERVKPVTEVLAIRRVHRGLDDARR